MKTQDLTMLVRPDVDNVVHFYLLVHFGEVLFGVEVLLALVVLLLQRGCDFFGGGFAFFCCVHP